MSLLESRASAADAAVLCGPDSSGQLSAECEQARHLYGGSAKVTRLGNRRPAAPWLGRLEWRSHCRALGFGPRPLEPFRTESPFRFPCQRTRRGSLVFGEERTTLKTSPCVSNVAQKITVSAIVLRSFPQYVPSLGPRCQLSKAHKAIQSKRAQEEEVLARQREIRKTERKSKRVATVHERVRASLRSTEKRPPAESSL